MTDNRLRSSPPRSPAAGGDAAPRRVYYRALGCLLALLLLSVAIHMASGLPAAQPYGSAILTVQVGVLLVVFYVVMCVYVFHARRRSAAAAVRANTPTDTCPDYWTRGAANRCTNVYDTPDGRFRYIVGGKKEMQVALGVAADTACAPGKASDAYPWVYLRNLCDAYKFNKV